MDRVAWRKAISRVAPNASACNLKFKIYLLGSCDWKKFKK